MAEIEVRFPPKLAFLFEPHRYKVAYGGRGGSKSWGYARALLVQGAEKRLRILCTREVQKSIKDSVHKLLCDQIESLGLTSFYEPLQNEIRGKNGTEFIFSGLSDQTAESIKSYEGVDKVWIEEAQSVSKRSWTILIPTIRKDLSEIWLSFNVGLDTDETYQRFVVNPPHDCVVAKINYSDNPWFPSVLEQERLHCKQTDPDNYPNIWEGEPKLAVEGAIYAREIMQAQEHGRIMPVPIDPKLKVHVICDLGFNDQMSIIMAQRQLSELRVVDYIEENQRTLDYYSAELKNRRYNWGTMWLPHDAKHKTLAASGRSTEDIMRTLGWTVQIVPDVGVEQGIKIGRMALQRTFFDKIKAARLVECLKRYRRAVPKNTNEPSNPVHDEYSHGADAFRYMAIIADSMTNDETWGKPIQYNNAGII